MSPGRMVRSLESVVAYELLEKRSFSQYVLVRLYDLDVTTGSIYLVRPLRLSMVFQTFARTRKPKGLQNLESATANHDRTGGIAAVGAPVEFQRGQVATDQGDGRA